MKILEKEELLNAYEKAWNDKTKKYINYKDVGKIVGKSESTVKHYTEKYKLQEELPDYFRCVHKTFHQFDKIN